MLDGETMVDHLSAMGVAVYIKDLQGRYMAINDEGAGLLGRPSDEILGGDDHALFTPRHAEMTILRDRFVVCRAEPLVFSSCARINATRSLTAFHSIKVALRHGPRKLAAGLLGLSFASTGRNLSAERETQAMLARIAQHEQGRLLAMLRRQGRLFAVS